MASSVERPGASRAARAGRAPDAPPAHADVLNNDEPLIDDAQKTVQDLEQDILDILGDDPSTGNPYGENLHKDIASRWQNILVNGLNKDNRITLQKLYLPAENCPYMTAPKLNAEIKAALTEVNNKKDIYSQSRQNQLTSCLAAIGKVLNIALAKNQNIPQDIIKPLSDAGRLLCDYHHKESLSRRYATMNSLSKETKDVLKNTKIDEFLFGSDLAEKLKTSKAISKSGLEMRTPVAGPSGVRRIASTVSQVPAVHRNPTLNARGAPRAPAAEPRANPASRRPPAPRPPASRARHAPPRQHQRSRRQ
ncbi:hypothetical protein MSG28_012736 [Choristoneura fumiferana]|uniref:Uncharacterized protein n=1 Tax=Choristoneura fumiferana TaxID=7141 RepID=A0ACC0JHX7_CHOFU|nr:hypothetical protein MSG28_012736 [Choristoneura fumiferana]